MLVKLTNFQNFQRIANDKQKLIEGIQMLQNKGAFFDEQYCHGDCPGCQTSEGGDCVTEEELKCISRWLDEEILIDI